MKIGIVHGYLLTGTGSNIYVRNLVQKFVEGGHEVFLFCQEPKPELINFINDINIFNTDNITFRQTLNRKTTFKGQCHFFKPNLHGILPVFVLDKYEGYTVKEFHNMPLDEIENYIFYNVKAIKTVLDKIEPDFIQTNHFIMSPYIIFKALGHKQIPYFLTIHGSCLNFSVKKDTRLVPYALTALESAYKCCTLSEHTAYELKEFLQSQNYQLKDDIKIIPAGCDTDVFNVSAASKKQNLKKLYKLFSANFKKGGKNPDITQQFANELSTFSKEKYSEIRNNQLKQLFKKYNEYYDKRLPDEDVIEKLKNINVEKEKIILFTGKYLWTKGIQDIITASPLIFEQIPDARIILVGFGDSREIFEGLIFALSSGDYELYTYLCEHHAALDIGTNVLTPDTSLTFLNKLKQDKKIKNYFKLAGNRSIKDKIIFTGIFNHEQLKYLLPCADIFVAPSIFTESFGLVAIEALSCGVFPMVTYAYGFKEISDIIFKCFPKETKDIKKLALDEYFIENLAHNIITVLNNNRFHTPDFKRKCYKIVENNYSWDAVAQIYENILKSK